MSIKLVVAAAVALLSLAAPAAAQDNSLAAKDIMSGAYAKAEQKLLAQMRFDQRPEVQLNLAAVYYATGRIDRARSLYEQVLQKDEVPMTVSTERTAGSHAIAHAGLRYLNQRQRMASR
ncbi:tetratricopeptide repeat protein [Sphingomonas azotifigens]|uniref:tetratricopeptide repeat protein n=1 Tax=Sphingomonas azotifigens TaxID=330920 RepID=UPI000A0383A9|nr:tetratricopeptide repeat protein [Sphingomonas azotifigens]